MKATVIFSALMMIAMISKSEIILDATSSKNVTNANILTIEHTINYGNMLIVNITSKDKEIVSVTDNNNPMLLADKVIQNHMTVAMFYICSPKFGRQTIKVNTSEKTDISVVVTSYSGVEVAAPFGTFSKKSNQSINAELIVECGYNDLVIDAFGCRNQIPAQETSQILNDITGTTLKAASTRTSKIVDPTLSWTMDVVNDWAYVAVALKEMHSLPVIISDFNAVADNSIIKLSWTTANEMNTEKYVILKSVNGLDFAEIGTINSNENSNMSNNYQFVDGNPAFGTQYYILSKVDQNKNTTLTDMISVNFKKSNAGVTLNVFPNPALAGSSLQVELNGTANQLYTIVISNTAGQLIDNYSVEADNSGKILTSISNNMNSGLYYVNATSADSKISKSFIIE